MFTNLPQELGFLFSGSKTSELGSLPWHAKPDIIQSGPGELGHKQKAVEWVFTPGATGHSHSHFLQRMFIGRWPYTGFVVRAEDSGVDNAILHSGGGER